MKQGNVRVSLTRTGRVAAVDFTQGIWIFDRLLVPSILQHLFDELGLFGRAGLERGKALGESDLLARRHAHAQPQSVMCDHRSDLTNILKWQRQNFPGDNRNRLHTQLLDVQHSSENPIAVKLEYFAASACISSPPPLDENNDRIS